VFYWRREDGLGLTEELHGLLSKTPDSYIVMNVYVVYNMSSVASSDELKRSMFLLISRLPSNPEYLSRKLIFLSPLP